MLTRSNTARAPERRAPTPKPRRPELRVVDPPPTRERMRPARVGTIAGALLFLAMFALAAFQTVLIRAQDRLDDLNAAVSEQTELDQHLTLQLADLQSPERIAQVARDRLGMIAPHTITFIEPAPDDDAKAMFVAPPPPSAPPTPTKAAPPASTANAASQKATTSSTTPPKAASTTTTTPKAKQSTTTTTQRSSGTNR